MGKKSPQRQADYGKNPWPAIFSTNGGVGYAGDHGVCGGEGMSSRSVRRLIERVAAKKEKKKSK